MIADRIGLTEMTVAGQCKRLQRERLEEQRQIVFRCDVARRAFDYLIGMLLSFRVPPLLVEKLALRVESWRQARFRVSVASTANVIVVVGLRDFPDGERFIARILQLDIPVEFVGRGVKTRMSTTYGWVLDREGRARNCVQPDPWADTELAR